MIYFTYIQNIISGFSKAVALASASIFIAGAAMAQAQTLQQYSSCDNLYSQGMAAPAGYGAAWDMVFGGFDVSVDCNSGTVTVGTGYQYQYIYKLTYLYQTNAWRPLNLSGVESGLISDNWYNGQAIASLNSVDLTQPTYVVGFVCDWAGSWKCGCADQACATPAWQLQAVRGTRSQAPAQSVPMNTITSNSMIAVAGGTLLVFPQAQLGVNGVVGLRSDNESVVHVTDVSQAMALASGTAHVQVTVGPYCPAGAPCAPVSDNFSQYNVTVTVQ